MDAANRLSALAAERGLLAPARSLPQAVTLAEVLRAPAVAESAGAPAGAGLRAPVGLDAAGVVELDLVGDGPHAVVAGTTGAGKSELLVSWVLAMATRHPPSAVTFLLVDFKGGAAFAPLAGLPHVVGTVSDLDARRSARAIESLRAELLRRERVLAEQGARSIDELEGARRDGPVPRLTRLVIVVDEFAAVVSGQPELHELFADISGRGRSLGLHLILCTQRPSGVVRDAVLANVTLRISLRVTDRGDSMAMLGTDAATRLAPTARGRALIADGSGQIREVQLARAEPGDADRLTGAQLQGGELPPAEIMWCDPLPELLPLDELSRDAAVDGGVGIPFGRVDLPDQQRQPIARHAPATDGHLLVLGAARSGRTTLLSTLAAGAAGAGVARIVVPGEPAEAWSLLDDLLRRADTGDGIVLVDDLDLLLDRMDPDARHDLIDLLARFVRSARHLGLVVSAQRLSGGLQSLAGSFDGRVLLRQPSRDEHVLCGGDGSAFDPRLPPGAGRWMGRRGGGATIQVAIGSAPLPAASIAELPVLRPETDRPLAVVCARPTPLARELTAAGARVVLLGDGPDPHDGELHVSRGEPPVVLLGDPDAWQAEWALLGVARRDLPVAVIGCGASELRAISRSRDAPPPLGDRRGECWWVDGGVVRRAVLELR
jgi:S-DNA-T family DNA segregation ATPase FtsK/SpoIIIE